MIVMIMTVIGIMNHDDKKTNLSKSFKHGEA